MSREAIEIVSLSKAFFGYGYELFAFFHNRNSDNIIVPLEPDTPYAPCGSAHNAGILFIKAYGLALSCGNYDIAFAFRFLNGKKLIAFVKVYSYLSALALILKVFCGSSLDNALLCDHYEIFVVVKSVKRNYRCNLFAFGKFKNVHKVRSLCRAGSFGDLVGFFHIYFAG